MRVLSPPQPDQPEEQPSIGPQRLVIAAREGNTFSLKFDVSYGADSFVDNITRDSFTENDVKNIANTAAIESGIELAKLEYIGPKILMVVDTPEERIETFYRALLRRAAETTDPIKARDSRLNGAKQGVSLRVARQARASGFKDLWQASSGLGFSVNQGAYPGSAATNAPTLNYNRETGEAALWIDDRYFEEFVQADEFALLMQVRDNPMLPVETTKGAWLVKYKHNQPSRIGISSDDILIFKSKQRAEDYIAKHRFVIST